MFCRLFQHKPNRNFYIIVNRYDLLGRKVVNIKVKNDMNNQLNELVVYDDLSAIDMINKYIHEAPNWWLNKVRFNKCLV